MDLEEKQLNSENVFDGRLLHVFKDEILLPNGHQTTREYIKHNGAVCIIPVLDNGKILMEEQFRYPFHKTILELPAGKIDPGEEVLHATVRELKEETGATAEELIDLGTYYPAAAYTNEIIYIYVAKGLHFEKQELDPDEFLELKEFTLEELISKIRNDEIPDGKTQTALLKYYVSQKG